MGYQEALILWQKSIRLEKNTRRLFDALQKIIKNDPGSLRSIAKMISILISQHGRLHKTLTQHLPEWLREVSNILKKIVEDPYTSE